MMRFRTTAVSVLCLALVSTIPKIASADTITITFENDPIGIVNDGFQSVESSLARFSTTFGAGLIIEQNFSGEFRGTRGLAVFGLPNNELVMDFAVPMQRISLWFGNDGFTPAQLDLAGLIVFNGNKLVGAEGVAFNGNDLMDQTITFSRAGAVFNRAIFFYRHAGAVAETVDDISLTPVPEPTTLALVAGGLLLSACRRRRAQCRQ
jgi:hypothetical protein